MMMMKSLRNGALLPLPPSPSSFPPAAASPTPPCQPSTDEAPADSPLRASHPRTSTSHIEDGIRPKSLLYPTVLRFDSLRSRDSQAAQLAQQHKFNLRKVRGCVFLQAEVWCSEGRDGAFDRSDLDALPPTLVHLATDDHSSRLRQSCCMIFSPFP
ncbi:hypothetical protein VTO73DRAFT_1189 [Trametes versicolor]